MSRKYAIEQPEKCQTCTDPANCESLKHIFQKPFDASGVLLDCKAFYIVFCELEERCRIPDDPEEKKRYHEESDAGKRPFLTPAIPAVQAMEPFTAYQLRHSYATMLYDADVDVKTAQKLLGHADFSVTMKIYTHLSAEKESAGIEKLNQHVTKCLGDSIRNKVKEG